MKPFKLLSPSKKSQKIMRRKLFFLEIKHNFQKIFSTKNLEILLPTLAFGIFILGLIQMQAPSFSHLQGSDYLSQVKNQTEQVTGKYYAKYAYVRSVK